MTRLMNHPLTSIKGETITALAEVLGLPSDLVMRAALRSLKTPIELEGTSAEDAIRIDAQLSERDKQTLLSMLELMRTKAGGHGGNTAPMNQARAGGAPADLDARRRAREADRVGTADDAVTPGEDGWVAPPPLEQLAADDTPSEAAARRRALDESEGA